MRNRTPALLVKGEHVLWQGQRLQVTRVYPPKTVEYPVPAFWVGDLMFTYRSSLREYRAFGFPADTEPCTFVF